MRERDRAMSAEERFAETISLTRALTAMSLAGIRAKYPNHSEDDVQYELARRRYGKAIAERAFGHTGPP
jgi:hypothetical protein